jgi:hypothetical protein
MAQQLPKFQGTPLVEIPEEVPVANFLVDKFGEAFLGEYNGRVASDFGNAPVLRVLSYDNGTVKGSNPFAVVLANKILGQEGIRTATPADLEKILKLKALGLSGTYEDSALVLRNGDEPNSYLAKDLDKQVKKRLGKLSAPVVIPLAYLAVRKDASSPHGVSFDLTEGSELIKAPILVEKYNGKSFSQTDKYGLPSVKGIGDGNRTLYTRGSGLSRLYLGRSLYLDSNVGSLASSNEYGRVVGVRAAGAPRKKSK